MCVKKYMYVTLYNHFFFFTLVNALVNINLTIRNTSMAFMHIVPKIVANMLKCPCFAKHNGRYL